MKKIVVIIVSIVIIILFLIGLYFYGLTGYNNKDVVSFTVRSGASKKEVVDNLYKSKLIKSKVAGTIYIYLNRDLMVQAGVFKLSRDMGVEEIFKNLASAKSDEYRLTLIEGKRFIDYIDEICNIYNFDKEEVLNKLSDKDYLNQLIKKYDFLDESILNSDIYYPLEGYLFADTYFFSSDATIEEIIEKMLDKTEEILDNYSAALEKTDYSYHEILTIASIIENETVYLEDKFDVSEVIYKRLALKMSLGMDVTAYYGVQKTFKEVLTNEDLKNNNPYNTRLLSFIGLPVGPICSPSDSSIKAALNPSDEDYVYFFADSDGKLHFANTYEEHQLNIKKYGD